MRDYNKAFRKFGISRRELPPYDSPQDFARKLKRRYSIADKRDLATRFRIQNLRRESECQIGKKF
jgi:hypothetical protein